MKENDTDALICQLTRAENRRDSSFALLVTVYIFNIVCLVISSPVLHIILLLPLAVSIAIWWLQVRNYRKIKEQFSLGLWFKINP